MFLPCPNCGFLVARAPARRDGSEQRCPRCGQVLRLDDAYADSATPPPASALRRPEPDRLSTPRPLDPGGAGAERAAGSLDAAPEIAPPKRGGRYARPPQVDSGAVRDAIHDAGDTRPTTPSTEAAATPSTAAAPVIVQPQPAPPPAAHVHTATPAARAAPSFVRAPAPARPPARRWPLYAGIATLAFVLALQLVLAQRDVLAAQARWRPLVETLCGALGCDVPAWREPSAFAMLDRSVLPKPGAPGVLTARASFRNDAQWPQPWPTLVLTLSDVDGMPLGRRAFTPAEYAGEDARVLMPGQSASAQFDVLEPAPGVVAFAFDFR